MKKRSYIDILLVGAAVTLLTLCALFVKPWVSADSIALILPDASASTGEGGKALDRCRSCNQGALRQLGLSPGVAWVKKDRTSNLLVVAYDSRTVAPDAIAAELSASGVSGRVAGVYGIKQYCANPCNIPGLRSATHPCGPGCRQPVHKGERQ